MDEFLRLRSYRQLTGDEEKKLFAFIQQLKPTAHFQGIYLYHLQDRTTSSASLRNRCYVRYNRVEYSQDLQKIFDEQKLEEINDSMMMK